jgi:hypothetical protein
VGGAQEEAFQLSFNGSLGVDFQGSLGKSHCLRYIAGGATNGSIRSVK